MKLVGIDKARANFADTIAAAQSEPIVLTRLGQPVGVLLGADFAEFEALKVLTDAVAKPKKKGRAA